MKKGYKECPFCANEIKEWAIKCQYCKEFLDWEKHQWWLSKSHWNQKIRSTNKVKRRSKRRKLGLILVLIIPIIGVSRFLITIIFRLLRSSTWSLENLSIIKNFINRILWLFSLFWLIWLIPWIIILAKSDSDYDSNIKLETNPRKLNNIYKEQDISNLPKRDIENMKHNSLVIKLHVAWAVVLNILTFWTFSIFYYWLIHSDLPKIKEDDFSAWKAIWFLFIPFFNIYRIFVFWLRLVDRINFQYTLRGYEKPISRKLTIAYLIICCIPYVNLVSIFILENILVYQIQNTINTLVDEK